MVNRPQFYYPDIGVLGEDLVAQWLRSKGWVILHRRWRCRWGEIDIIARKSSPMLVFVEVKTRSCGNWDAGGLLSITPQKQAKLWQTARSFLATYPLFGNYPCHFDVALVCCKPLSKTQRQELSEPFVTLEASASPVSLLVSGATGGNPGYQLLLQDYIPSGFDGIH